MRFAREFAMTHNRTYAAKMAGYAAPSTSAARVMDRPAVQAEIARLQTARLFDEALPAAVDCLIGLLKNDKAPAGARVAAAKVVMDRTLGDEGARNGEKQPHEMSASELAKAIVDAKLKAASLENLKADRARPVLDAEPVEVAPEADLFA